MLTWGFEAEAARLAARARERTKRMRKGLPCDSSTSSSSFWGSESESLSTSDEEYQKIIAGEEEDTDDEKQKTAMLQRQFDMFDTDKSGGLTIEEFIKLGMEPPSPEMNRGNIHNRFGAAGGSRSSLSDRVDQIEERLNETNKKLDQILTLLKDKKK